MARPLKKGLDYFSLDVNFYNDIKLRKIVRRKGADALLIYTILLCVIYENGYYRKMDDDIYFLISEATGYGEDKVKKTIQYCVKTGLFDEESYNKHHILTSRGIQERYFSIAALTKRKKEKSLPYLLIEKTNKVISEETKKNSEETGINSEETKKNSEECRVNCNEKLVYSEDSGGNHSRKTVNSEVSGGNSSPKDINSEENRKNSEKSAQRKEKRKIKGKYLDDSLRSSSSSSEPTTVPDEEIDLLSFQEFFNRTMEEHHAQIPRIIRITGNRRTAILARFREYGKEALWTAVMNAATAPFLNGASEKPFVASLDWIFRPNNFPKVLEGNYNHSVITSNSNQHGTGSNNGYRTSEDIINGAVRIIHELREEGRQPKEELPVV